jgi:hypothetical protein
MKTITSPYFSLADHLSFSIIIAAGHIYYVKDLKNQWKYLETTALSKYLCPW